MTRYFLAPDGEDEPTVWRATDRDPVAVVRRCEVSPEAWGLVTAQVAQVSA